MIEPIRTHPVDAPRLPNGQTLTKRWPVLTYGPTPQISTADWRLRVWGAVERPIELDWAELLALPQARVRADMHCVTTWSLYDVVWSGVRVRDVLALARPTALATDVLQHAYGDYTTNVELTAMLDDDVLIAHGADGGGQAGELDPEHGGPARIVVPKRWAWKGAKWVNGLQVLTHDQRGFWEVNGYHNHGDPWGDGEERYSHQERARAVRKAGNALRR